MDNGPPEQSVPNSQLDIEEDKKKKALAAAERDGSAPARKVFANQAVVTEEEMVSAEFMKAEIAGVEKFYQTKIRDMQKEAQGEMEESQKLVGRLQRQIEKLEAELEAVKKAVGTSANPLRELNMNI
jgi:uncharacterized protein YlxW (UPF0749 family)